MAIYKFFREIWDTSSDYGGFWESDYFSEKYFDTTEDEIIAYTKKENDRLVLKRTNELVEAIDVLKSSDKDNQTIENEIKKLVKELIHIEYKPFEQMDSFGWKIVMKEQFVYEKLEVFTLERRRDNNFHSKKV